MSDGLDMRPFENLWNTLEGLEEEKGNEEVPEIDAESALEDSFDLLVHTEKFMRGAIYHDSERSYELGDVAFDDLSQKISILNMQYPHRAECLQQAYEELREYKKEISERFEDRVDSIVERSYREVSISFEEYESSRLN